jgi:hypothetical protein
MDCFTGSHVILGYFVIEKNKPTNIYEGQI